MPFLSGLREVAAPERADTAVTRDAPRRYRAPEIDTDGRGHLDGGSRLRRPALPACTEALLHRLVMAYVRGMSSLAIKAARLLTGAHVAMYRASKGKVGGSMGGTQVGLLTTIGRVSGRRRTTPVMTFPHEDGALVVVASNGGSDRPPSWYGNLRADPRVEVQGGPRVRPMVARTATAPEKAEIWPHIIVTAKNFEGYEKKTTRDIPVVILTPVSDGS
jgi:deazaflavin-dependent oxidoreductase (nitroreductase family)